MHKKATQLMQKSHTTSKNERNTVCLHLALFYSIVYSSETHRYISYRLNNIHTNTNKYNYNNGINKSNNAFQEFFKNYRLHDSDFMKTSYIIRTANEKILHPFVCQ